MAREYRPAMHITVVRHIQHANIRQIVMKTILHRTAQVQIQNAYGQIQMHVQRVHIAQKMALVRLPVQTAEHQMPVPRPKPSVINAVTTSQLMVVPQMRIKTK